MYRDDRDAVAERAQILEHELASVRAELEQTRAALRASDERARMFEAEADRLRAMQRGRAMARGSDTWTGAVALGFAAGFGAALIMFMVATGG